MQRSNATHNSSARLSAGSPKSARSPMKPFGSPSVRSPAGATQASPLLARRPNTASGLRFLPSDPMPSTRTPVPPMRGPNGLVLQTPKKLDQSPSFILEGARGLAPEKLPEGSVHGVNPVIKWKVDTLREQQKTSDIELGSAVQLRSAAIVETHNSMNRLIDEWEYTQQQSELLRESLQNAAVELRSAREFSNIHRQHIEDLRAESRELSMKEAELDLTTSALPWVKYLPPDLPVCKLCTPYHVPVSLCRIVRGHRNDLPEGEVFDAVTFLHGNFTENASRRGRGKLAYVPFATKVEALSEDADVNSILGSRCCRNDRGPSVEMATSYAWLTSMSTATEKDSHDLKNTIGSDPEADIELEHVHSYGGSSSKQNLFYLHTGALLFNSGTICVVHDLISDTQRFFRHHTEFVSGFALLPYQADNLVASSQDGINPRICIWNTATTHLVSMLDGSQPNSVGSYAGARVFPLYLEAGVRSMSFSRDGRRLIVLADDAEGSIVIHDCSSKSTECKWTSSICVATAKATDKRGERALNVNFSPFSNNIVTSGVKHMKFWEVHPGGEMLSRTGVFGSEDSNDVQLCTGFLDAETCLTGTATGMIWIWKGIRVLQVVAWAHEGPIFDLAIDGRMVLSGGQDMKLCFWNFQKDFRVVPPGKIGRGEMLVKQLDIADAVKRGNPGRNGRWLADIGVGCVKALAWNSHKVFVGTSFNHVFVVDDLQHAAALIMSGHHRGGMTGMCSHPKLPLVLSAGREGTILVRNMVTKKTVLARNLEINRATRKDPKSVGVSVVKHKTKAVIPPKKIVKAAPKPGEPVEQKDPIFGDDEEDEGETDSESDEDKPENRRKRKMDWPVQLTSMDVCTHGTHVAVGQNDGGFAVISLEYDGQELIFDDMFAIVPKKPRGDPVTCVKISPSVACIAVGFSRGYVRVYQTTTLWKRKAPYVVCKGLYGQVTHIDWDDKSRCIRVNDSCNDLKIFDIRTGSEIDYFGALYTVKLKRLRFVPPEHRQSSQYPRVDFESHPEAKIVGFGLSRRAPYTVQCFNSLVDGEGIPEFEDGYSNEEIQIGDRIIEVAGHAIEQMGFDALKHLLHGPPCKPECGTECLHTSVSIVFARDRKGVLNVGPGTGIKSHSAKKMNIKNCGPFYMEGKWITSNCPLTWASHRLYMEKYIPGEILSITRSSKQNMMATGDAYGHVTIMGYPCDPTRVINKEGQSLFCPVDYVCFTDKDRHLLVGNRVNSMLMQWKPLLVTEGKRQIENDPDKTPTKAQDGITNIHLRLILDRPLASKGAIGGVLRDKPAGEDAFDATLQWWQNSCPGTNDKDGQEGALCDRELILEHVYGYNGRESRHNVFELMNGDLLFPVGCLCVLNRADGAMSQISSATKHITQYFFRGHSDFVTSLAVHPNGRIIASGDCSPRPLICVWDIESSDWIQRSLYTGLVTIRGFHKSGISALSFSSDGEHLVSVGEDTKNSIAVYEWQKDSLMPYAIVPSGPNRVICCVFNPYAFEFITCGVKHVSFWSFEHNPSNQIETQIAVQSVKSYPGQDLTDVLLEALLSYDPILLAKMCPATIVSVETLLSEQFMEWAMHDQECSDTYTKAKALGESYLVSTNICATFIDRETAMTGSADGKILMWTNAKLMSFVDGHNGPVFDMDCPKNRGKFRGDLMISNVKNEKHFVTVEVQGAATDDVMNIVAKEALTEWHKEFKRTHFQKRDPPLLKNALIRWEASDPQEFVTCGEDGAVKLWAMRQILVIGHSKYDVTDLFEKFGSGMRGGHKFRSRTVVFDEFMLCLGHLHLLYETQHLHDNHHAYETTQHSDYLRLSKAEAVRIFRDQNAPELHYGDFVTCIERIFRLLEVRAEADNLQLIKIREELEEDLLELTAAQQKDTTGSFIDTFDYRILKVREDIQHIDTKLRKGRISMHNIMKYVRAIQLETADTNSSSEVSCIRSIYMKTGTIFVGTGSNSIYAFDMQSGKWNVRICGHKHGVISSMSVCPMNPNLMVSGGQDSQLILWNGRSKCPQDRRMFSSIIGAVDFSPVLKEILAVGLHSGELVILDVSKGALSNHVTVSHVQESISALRFSPDGNWLAVGYHSAQVRLFQICWNSVEIPDRFELRQHPSTFLGHNGPVTTIDWSSDSKIIQTASQLAGELLYWSCASGQIMQGASMTRIKELKWSTFTSIFGWHMHGPHHHITKHEKIINKDVVPFIGQRVKRKSCVPSARSEIYEKDGTIVRLSRDKRCDVKWDTNVVEGTVGVCNIKLRTINIGWGGSPQFDLVLAEQTAPSHGLEITSTDMSNVIDKNNPAFLAAGDSGGYIQLLPVAPPVSVADAMVVRQLHAHPGGTHIVKFAGNDKKLYSTGRLDHGICVWTCQPHVDIFFSVADVLRKCASTGVREFFGGLALLADDLFPENVVVSLNKRNRIKDILEQVKAGLTFGPKDIVGLTISLEDEGESVPKNAAEEVHKEKSIKHDLSEAVGILQSRIEYCGWERASTDPADYRFRWSNVHLNLIAAEFEGFDKISSAERFANQIIEQIHDSTSKLKKLMTTRLAIRADKKRAFEMEPPPRPPPNSNNKTSRHVRACEYSGCEGAVVEINEKRAKMKPAGDLGFQVSRTAGFDFRFRRLRSRIFDPIIRTGVTTVNATQPSKAPKPLYRAKKPDMNHQQLVTIFQIMDYGDRGWISHADFMLGLRRNPDFAGLLGLPSIELQKVASRHIYELRYGDEGLDSSGIDDTKKMDMEEFVSFFGQIKRQIKPLESIENSKWTMSTNAMKPPNICDAMLSIQGPAPPVRRWNEKLRSNSVLPVLTKEEALAIFNELGLSKNDCITQADFVCLLQRNPHLEEKLGSKKIMAHELAAFFSDVGIWNPFVDKEIKKQSVPIGVAFQAFQTIDEEGQGWFMIGSFVTGLKRFPAIAENLGLLSRSMRDDALPQIYEYLYRTKPVIASRKINIVEFIMIFSNCDLGDIGLAVPYRPPKRPRMVPLSTPFRVFQRYFPRSEHSVSHKDFVELLRQYPDAADSLGLQSWIKESNASLQIYQLLFGGEEFDEERPVTLGDLFRSFSGHEVEDLALDVPYVRDTGPQRPAFILPKTAVAAFHKIGSTSSAYITHGDMVEAMKNSDELAKTLGFFKPIKEEEGTHIIFQIMHGLKTADASRKVEFDEFFYFFTGQKAESFGMTLPHREAVQKKNLSLIDLSVALALWERLDDYERGFISHREFWEKMGQNPDIAEKLGLLKLIEQEDGSTQIYSLMNPGQRTVNDFQKYYMAFWVKFFTGQDLGKQEAILRNWKQLTKEVAGMPKWRKLVVRLQLENASLTSVRGILRCKQATVKATELALAFLDAIQSPRLVMNDGDDLRVLEVIACVAYVAAYKGPFRISQLDLCTNHTKAAYRKRQENLAQA